ncbi:RimK family protein [Pelagicoccus sp. SDUM812003]|uniref:RimK family protein n=1 Tax=Pelagicoccus sp. SDUM812003 TaxID=3041267 RepID=UPI00280D9CB7|nr:RimK family protein [Pelagicoccus sp. SDUM812003]MDQ8201910.1 RimK family protein [Pelagicoccus sp. SDUM812003]
MKNGTSFVDSPFRIVVDSLSKIPERFQSLPIITSSVYLSTEYAERKRLKIVNLCSHRKALSTSYYVSLLADARDHRAIPEAKTLHQLESKLLIRDAIREHDDLIQSSFRRLLASHFTLSVYFGKNLAKSYDKLAKRLYALFPCPLVQYQFHKKDGKWKLKEVVQLGLHQTPEEHHDFIKEQLDSMLHKRWRRDNPNKTYRYEIAILVNEQEANSPSDAGALAKFCKAAQTLDMRAEIISPRDLPRLMEFDALFMRETTRLDNHTIRFSLKAERSGMVVIDDPESIRRCCNKVYLAELLRTRNIPTPRSTLITRRNLQEVAPTFSFPLVVKIPDGSFSIGVHKVKSEEELLTLCKELLGTSSILIAQEFVPTEFDWRIGIIDGRPLYACRYYMSKGHWQIYNHAVKGADSTGDSNGVPIDQVPAVVLDTALKASSLIGKGLYGVDIKQSGDTAMVIEVNDNPSIDAGVEDELIGDELYLAIMNTFLKRLEAKRERASQQNEPSS